MKNGVFWFIAGLLIAINLSIIATGSRIEAAINRTNSFYLCIELKKLGGDDPSCDRLTARKSDALLPASVERVL